MNSADIAAEARDRITGADLGGRVIGLARRVVAKPLAQVEGLPAVAMAQIQPGDILWRPGHVGIYAGNGWAIAATQTGDVIRYQKASGYQRAVRP